MIVGDLITRQKVVDEARSWLGTPWVHMSRVKGAGVDCGQFLAAVFETAGIVPHIEVPPYPSDWALHRSDEKFLAVVETYAAKTERHDPGNIALFKYGRCVSHAGIVVCWPVIIHANMRLRVVMLDDVQVNPDLRDRFVGLWSPWEKL